MTIRTNTATYFTLATRIGAREKYLLKKNTPNDIWEVIKEIE